MRVIVLALSLLALLGCQQLKAQFRTECTHGCHISSCNKKNCGERCKRGPKCQGCWKN